MYSQARKFFHCKEIHKLMMTLLSLDQFELSLSCSRASCLLLLRNLVHVKVLN